MRPEEELIILLNHGTSIKEIRTLINTYPSLDLYYSSINLSTPLTTAIDRSDPTILEMLISKIPADLNGTLTHPCGKTPLMHAAYYAKNPDILHILIRKGANYKKCDINGWNCLFYAVLGERLLNIAALLFYQVPIESRDFTGRSPLILSVYLSSSKVLDFLVSQGADVNAVDKNGLSAFHLAVLWRQRDCMTKLSKCRSLVDLPPPFSKASTSLIIEELMSNNVLPVSKDLSKADMQQVIRL